MGVALEFTPVQDRLFEKATEGPYRYLGFGGAIRGTKTWGSLGTLVLLCRMFPRSRWAVVRKDLPTLRRNTIPSFEKLRATCDGFVGPLNQTEWTYTCANGSQIILFPESLDIDPDWSRWKGLEVNGFLLEEADELAEGSFHKAIERAGAWIVKDGANPAPLVLCTFNPTPGWPKHVFYEPWKMGTIAAPYAFIPATIADNPFVTEDYRASLKNLPEQEYRRFVEGDWEVLSGRYYDTLNPPVQKVPRKDLPKDLPAHWEYWVGYDWGYAHWAVAGAFCMTPEGAVFLLDSVWVRKQQDHEQAGAIVRLLADAKVPREPQHVVIYAGHDCWARVTARGGSGVSTFDVFCQAGLSMLRADIDPVNGGRAVRRMLAAADDTRTQGLYYVDTPNNARVWQQLATIMPDENDVNKPGKVDADAEGRGGDDGADMLRHGVATRVMAPSDPAEQRRGEDVNVGYDPRTGQPVDPMWQRFEREQKLKQGTARPRLNPYARNR
jgi:hypothetical protein